MWPISRPNRYSLLALVMFGAVGLSVVAMADPNAPAKVKTIRILPQPAEDHGAQPTSSAKSAGVRLLTVDPHRVRTMTVRPEPGLTNTPDYHFAPATPDPSQAAPQ